MQNQSGRHPNKWDRTAEVVQVNDHDNYIMKMHGSGRLTSRNRKHLRQIQPYALPNNSLYATAQQPPADVVSQHTDKFATSSPSTPIEVPVASDQSAATITEQSLPSLVTDLTSSPKEIDLALHLSPSAPQTTQPTTPPPREGLTGPSPSPSSKNAHSNMQPIAPVERSSESVPQHEPRTARKRSAPKWHDDYIMK